MERCLHRYPKRTDSQKTKNTESNVLTKNHCCPCEENRSIAAELNKQNRENVKCISCLDEENRYRLTEQVMNDLKSRQKKTLLRMKQRLRSDTREPDIVKIKNTVDNELLKNHSCPCDENRRIVAEINKKNKENSTCISCLDEEERYKLIEQVIKDLKSRQKKTLQRKAEMKQSLHRDPRTTDCLKKYNTENYKISMKYRCPCEENRRMAAELNKQNEDNAKCIICLDEEKKYKLSEQVIKDLKSRQKKTHPREAKMVRYLHREPRRTDSTKINNTGNYDLSKKYGCPCDENRRITSKLDKQNEENAKCITYFDEEERYKSTKQNNVYKKKQRCPFKNILQYIKSRRRKTKIKRCHPIRVDSKIIGNTKSYDLSNKHSCLCEENRRSDVELKKHNKVNAKCSCNYEKERYKLNKLNNVYKRKHRCPFKNIIQYLKFRQKKTPIKETKTEQCLCIDSKRTILKEMKNTGNNDISEKHKCACQANSVITTELNKLDNENAKFTSYLHQKEIFKLPDKDNGYKKKSRCPLKNIKIQDLMSSPNEVSYSDLKRKTLELKLKEQELAKSNLILQRKIAEYKKKNDRSAKKDLKAAKKLSEARNKLQRVMNARNKCEKRYKNKNKRRKTSRHWYSSVKNMLEKIGCCKVRVRNRRHTIISTCEDYFKNICSLDCPHRPQQRGSCCCNNQVAPRRQSHWDAASGDCYLMALGRTPCLWPHNAFPLFYPRCLAPPPQCTFRQAVLCMTSFLMWLPCIICIILCKCFFCACCSDC